MVNRVPTRVLTWGGWIEDKLPDGDCVVVCISGNPGVTTFYSTFLSAINKQLNCPVWIVNHAGHEVPSLEQSTGADLPVSEDPELYDLAGQIRHKVEFVKQFVPESKDIYFIGHSVGAKIVLELLKHREIETRTKKCYLLFPTLEHIAKTPNGKILIPTVTYGLSVILFFAWIYANFPHVIRRWMMQAYFFVRGEHTDEHFFNAALYLTLPRTLRSVFSLAMDEMEKIKDLDVKALDDYNEKLKIYFGTSDGWAPLAYYENLKKAKPDVDALVLDDKFQHAFVLDSSEEMANILVEEIKKERRK